MSTIEKNEKYLSGDSPVYGKSRGNRLARRARSFKEDFLEIISQMRSPGGSSTRSGSPCSLKSKAKVPDHSELTQEKNPSKDLECNIRQAQLALKHFRDVVSKNKLEMLPGNGTVVLETVTAIHVLLKKYVLNEQSSTLVSATNLVYQSVAKLIKLCDDYLLVGEKALGKENVAEIVNLVEHAIQNLVSLTKDKIILRDPGHKSINDNSDCHDKNKQRGSSEKNGLELGQRNSLPDIPLTPREREILERTSAFVLERHSQSTENVSDDSPPPKPPHPDRTHLDSSFPPPLPPKKRQKNVYDSLVMKNSMECLSIRSKSPEDSSSLLSASGGSLDSVLNHCRDVEDLPVLIGQTEDDVEENVTIAKNFIENDCSKIFYWDSSSFTGENVHLANSTAVLDSARYSPVLVTETIPSDNSPAKLDRFSGSQAESGICSMPSRRSSCQSYSASSQQLSSTRSSQQSYTSQESHHTEKKVISTVETTNSQKFQSFTMESNQNHTSSQRTITSSSSSEKLSYQKQTYLKCCTNKSSTETEGFWMTKDSIKKLDDLPCYHNHEIKLQECPLLTSFLSSPCEPKDFRQLSVDLDDIKMSFEVDKPPALPEKVRSRRRGDRHPSQYDNFNGGILTVENSTEKTCSLSSTVIEDGVVNHKQSALSTLDSVKTTCGGGISSSSQVNSVEGHIEEVKSSGEEHSVQKMGYSVTESTNVQTPDGKPPPLPPKKKHMFQSVAYSVMAYMEIFGNASHANANEFLRHSVNAYSLLQSEWQQHQKLLTSAQSCSFNISFESAQTTPVRKSESKSGGANVPPALPPKKRTRSTTSSPPPTPTLLPDVEIARRGDESMEKHGESEISLTDESSARNENAPPSSPASADKNLILPEKSCREGEKEDDVSLLSQLNVSKYLVFKKEEDEGPDIRGGHPDALVIHATKAHKNDFLYQEAFLTTYRTFMTPLELIQKLCFRHEKFSSSPDSPKQRAARESFSLLVRVVSDLTLTDLEQVVLQTLMEFVQKLLCRGDLTMAKALRVIMLSKYEAKKMYLNSNNHLPSHNVFTRQSLLLDFKSEQIAEQMTLLDAELFLKIEIPEVLIWAQEQNEERSPNLTKFTEHFNKMSYWARSRILEQNDGKEREKYVVKFIKIMKHLRKINNFNSYLALLSALDSAPIRRLEWQKHITEGLKEYCALIDSSSSFRAYRQALAETSPPCIPYIGLVLQDLTFVHIGNTNILPNGGINFSKRWQQFNIVENMKRFKKGSYSYKKNERIIAFFNGFDDSLSEEAMWQISEKIKPRGGKKI